MMEKEKMDAKLEEMLSDLKQMMVDTGMTDGDGVTPINELHAELMRIIPAVKGMDHAVDELISMAEDEQQKRFLTNANDRITEAVYWIVATLSLIESSHKPE